MEDLLAEGYEKTIKRLRSEKEELIKKNKILIWAFVTSLIVGGFSCGYMIAENVQGERAINIILEHPEIPKEIKKKFEEKQ